jgi:hypothetical protein
MEDRSPSMRELATLELTRVKDMGCTKAHLNESKWVILELNQAKNMLGVSGITIPLFTLIPKRNRKPDIIQVYSIISIINYN